MEKEYIKFFQGTTLMLIWIFGMAILLMYGGTGFLFGVIFTGMWLFLTIRLLYPKQETKVEKKKK